MAVEINFDLVIESGEDPVDMKAGLLSMQGVSDAVRCVGETVLTGRVPERQSSKSLVRTELKRSFKGSYGHTFSLNVYDQALNEKLRVVGESVVVELLSYFLNESVYRDSNRLSLKAQSVLKGLEEKSLQVVSKLRQSSLSSIHDVSLKFGYDLKIRHVKNNVEKTVVAKFDRESALSLQTVRSDESVKILVGITRLNIHTGNGRLQINGEDETVAFGFNGSYKNVGVNIKKILSENLDLNNGIESKKWKYLEVVAYPMKLKDGKIVKYIVKEVYEN